MSPFLSRGIKSLSRCLLTAQSMHKMPEVFQHTVYVLLQYDLSENPSYDLASVFWAVSVWIISIPCCKRKYETNTKHTHTPLSKYIQKTKREKSERTCINGYKYLETTGTLSSNLSHPPYKSYIWRRWTTLWQCLPSSLHWTSGPDDKFWMAN